MDSVYKPLILDLYNSKEEQLYNDLRNDKKNTVSDTIISQLKELIKQRNPKTRFTGDIYDSYIEKIIAGKSIEKYGKWIYYPWLNQLIHILDQDEFVELRTVRNRYKITAEEQAVLSQKVIGIIGLSVGHAIAVTAASERICKKLLLADFDTLELTNLNRIKTSIRNLGLQKTIIAAREISEIDPYIEIECFNEGLNENNIYNFLQGDWGKVDLCIEECDDFYVKFATRYACKALKIPVLMDTSDRGLLDVERFDLEPERPVFHGLTTVTDLNQIKNLTMEQKIPYLYEIVNMDIMSDRMKASILEIEESITGWPQLSSAVTYGSGMTVDIARKILLDIFHESGRYFVDLDQIFIDKKNKTTDDYNSEVNIPIKDLNLDTIFLSEQNKSIHIDSTVIENIISAAIRAPSGGNNQPWKWVSSGKSIYVFLDKTRLSPYTDYQFLGSKLSLGCAVENAIIAAQHYGFETEIKTMDVSDGNMGFELVLSELNQVSTDQSNESLFQSIALRQTNRRNSVYKAFEPSHKEALKHAVSLIPGAELHFIDNRKQLDELKEIIAESDILRFLNKNLFHEMINEVRWTREEALEKPYGIEMDTFEISAREKVGFKIASSWDVASVLKKIGGKALGDISKRQISQSTAIVLLTMPQVNEDNFFHGGRALERFWLTAANLQMGVHPMVPLLYFFMRLNQIHDECFDEKELKTLRHLREKWNLIFPSNRGKAEIFMARLFYPDKSAPMSIRMPLSQVLEYR